MRPYRTIKLEEFPDIGDIQSEARASHVGRLPERGGDFKPYIRNKPKKASIRRMLKRSDKARSAREGLNGDERGMFSTKTKRLIADAVQHILRERIDPAS